MGKLAPRQALRSKWAGTTIIVTLGCYLLCVTGPLHALDPNKHITQYIHTSWRTQDGSAAASIDQITQTSDGFLWFASRYRDIYRFDGVRFLPWLLLGDSRSRSRIAGLSGDWRTHDVVLYCSCPAEITSARVALSEPTSRPAVKYFRAGLPTLAFLQYWTWFCLPNFRCIFRNSSVARELT